MSLYGGSKAAIRQFVRGWISEVKERGVRINVLSPGAIDTPSLRTPWPARPERRTSSVR